jgi:predicted acylesterase/phospholipase RssA
MPYQVAITISGAVSLGSYEAGVLYELLKAMACENGAAPDAKRFVVDVVTGASAGAMTAAVVAQKVLLDATALDKPYQNSLYAAWVTDVGMKGLTELKPDENAKMSVLSSDLIESISVRHLKALFTTGQPVAPAPHPASGGALRLGMTVSNLNGVDYEVPTRTGGTFVSTWFRDQATFVLGSATTPDQVSQWDQVRLTALASGAFPFAFRARALDRKPADYPDRGAAHLSSSVFSGPKRTFTFTDGGVFDNTPLGLAKTLVDQANPEHTNHGERLYFFVSPNASASASQRSLQQENATLGRMAQAMLVGVMGQAQFQDWLFAEKVNDRIGQFDRRVAEMAQNFTPAHYAIPLAALAENAGPHRARLQAQYPAEHQQVLAASQNNADLVNAFSDEVHRLEELSGLGDKDEMNIFGVTASPSELAGAQWSSFLGFVDQGFRDHDYDVGRTKARAMLIAARDPATRAPLFPQYTQTVQTNPPSEAWLAIRPQVPGLAGMTAAKLSPAQKRLLQDLFAARLERQWQQTKVGLPLRLLLRYAVLPWLMKQALEH